MARTRDAACCALRSASLDGRLAGDASQDLANGSVRPRFRLALLDLRRGEGVQVEAEGGELHGGASLVCGVSLSALSVLRVL